MQFFRRERTQIAFDSFVGAAEQNSVSVIQLCGFFIQGKASFILYVCLFKFANTLLKKIRALCNYGHEGQSVTIFLVLHFLCATIDTFLKIICTFIRSSLRLFRFKICPLFAYFR